MFLSLKRSIESLLPAYLLVWSQALDINVLVKTDVAVKSITHGSHGSFPPQQMFKTDIKSYLKHNLSQRVNFA